MKPLLLSTVLLSLFAQRGCLTEAAAGDAPGAFLLLPHSTTTPNTIRTTTKRNGLWSVPGGRPSRDCRCWASSSSSSDAATLVQTGAPPSAEWELDCYSRPVMMKNGKKLWEVLITDSNGSFRLCQPLESNKVNSRELRRVIEESMEQAEVKPTVVRFFRGAMFNMISIALSELEVIAKPSRRTFALAQWLEERNRDVYPKMKGFRKSMRKSSRPSFLDVPIPVKLPDALRGEKYAFVALPLAEFLPGGSITAENIGVGRLCPIPEGLAGDAFVQGIVILSERAKPLAALFKSREISAFTADLRERILLLESDIDKQYLVAKLNDEQRKEGEAFEEGKDALGGLHFLSVQQDEDDDEPQGFWLLRAIPRDL